MGKKKRMVLLVLGIIILGIAITSYYPTLLFLGDYSIIGYSASTSAFFSCQG